MFQQTFLAGALWMACAAALAFTTPVRAANRATAILSDVQITLIDLDPSDGIAPSVDVLASYIEIRDVYGSGPGGEAQPVGDRAPGPFNSVDLSLAGNGLAGRFTVVGSGAVPGFSASAVSEVLPAVAPGETFYSGVIFYASQQFTLSPATQLVLSGRVQVGAEAEVGAIQAGRTSAFGGFNVWNIAGLQQRFDVGVSAAPDAAADDRSGNVVLTNNSNQAMWGGLSLTVGTNAGSTPVLPPVPEPASWALLLAGGLALALLLPAGIAGQVSRQVPPAGTSVESARPPAGCRPSGHGSRRC